MEMVSDNRGARVVVDGPNEQDLTRLVRQIAYLNTRFGYKRCSLFVYPESDYYTCAVVLITTYPL